MMELQFIFLYVYEEMWKVHLNILPTFLEALGKKTRKCQEGYIEELTRFPLCLNSKTWFVNFWNVYQSFLYWISMSQIVHFQKILEVSK